MTTYDSLPKRLREDPEESGPPPAGREELAPQQTDLKRHKSENESPKPYIARSISRASSYFLWNKCGRARRGTLYLPHYAVQTPAFMPVGTHGAMKMILGDRLRKLGPELILANAYHMGSDIDPDRLTRLGGLHKLAGWPRGLLTDSGGFQMVSLTELMTVKEEGVEFVHPVTKEKMLLTPEKSMEIQKAIGADVVMALDHVISSIADDRPQFEVATERTTRWLDRCLAIMENSETQNLWAIVQGGPHMDLREKSLADLKTRNVPGFAIGGLSGGEAKSTFWQHIELATRELPENKSRYVMGVGYTIDILVCVALGADLFDCVYPTRTARFGVALTDQGPLRLKSKNFENDFRPVSDECDCECCQNFTRAHIRRLLGKQAAAQALLSEHNLRYMFNFMKRARDSIEKGSFPSFVSLILSRMWPNQPPPDWVQDALKAAGVWQRMPTQ